MTSNKQWEEEFDAEFNFKDYPITREGLLTFIRTNFISKTELAEVIEELTIENPDDAIEEAYAGAFNDLKAKLGIT